MVFFAQKNDYVSAKTSLATFGFGLIAYGRMISSPTNTLGSLKHAGGWYPPLQVRLLEDDIPPYKHIGVAEILWKIISPYEYIGIA